MKQEMNTHFTNPKCHFFLLSLLFLVTISQSAISQGLGCKALEFRAIPQSGQCCYKLLVNNSTPDNCFQQVNLNVSPDAFLNFTGLSGWRTNQVSASEYNIRPAVGFIPLGLTEIASFCIEGGPASQLLFQWENLCLLESCDSLMNIKGCLPKGTIDGYVYVDIGCQGKPYLNQPGLENWTVEVYDINLNLVSTTQTDSVGYYAIYDLPKGNYLVKIVNNPGWTPKIPISGEISILVEKDRTKRANFGMCYQDCSCDSLNINLEQVDEVYNDTTKYYLNIFNKESYCFNEIEIAVDSGKIVLTEVLYQNWDVQSLSENKILMLPPNGLVPLKHTIPLLMYVVGNDLLNISIETRNFIGNDVLKCRHQYQFNKPPTKPRPNCCPANAATPGPNIAIDPNFNLNTPQFTWSPGVYTYTNTNFGPGNIYIGTGSLATSLNPGFFPYSGKSGLPGDKYLIVDASTISTGYLWKQTQFLNPGELYTFCAYFKNLLFPGPNPSNASNPQLQLRVYKSGLKAQSTILTLKEGDPWTQLTLSFIAAGGGAYDFEIWSLNQITNGNDFGVDCVSIQSCIPEEKCCVSKDSFCDRLMKYISYVVDEPNCKLSLNIGNIPPCDSIMVLNWGDNQSTGLYHGAISSIMHTYSGAGVYYLSYLAIEWDFTVNPPRICNEKVITDTIVMTCGRCACPAPAFFSGNLATDGDFPTNSTSWFNNTLLTFTNVYSGPGSNEYTIAPNTQAFDPGLPSCTDHTPGNNMLIASFNTAFTDLVEHTVNVVPNTTYFIEYFIMTPSNSSFTTGVLDADNGYTIIGQSALLNGNCQWYKMCFRWFSGNKTKLHYIIGATNNTVPVGSDVKVALDDISVRSCGFINKPCICPSSPLFLDLNVSGKTTVLTSLPHGVQTPVIQCTNSPLIISGYYGCVNPDTSSICPETIVKYELIGPNNLTILGGITTNYTSIFIPGTLVNNPGTYKIRLATLCPGVKDSCIHEFDWIVKCDSCKCDPKLDWATVLGIAPHPSGVGLNNPNQSLHIGCVKYDNALFLYGQIHCDPDSCSKKDSIFWTLSRPFPNTDTNGVSYALSPDFNISIPWSAFDVGGGNYTLTIHRSCGSAICDRSIQIIVDPCPCLCDSLTKDVSFGFDVTGSKSSCKRKFKPQSLCKSDYVNWLINGIHNPLNATSGNNPFEFAFTGNGPFTICMVVTRVDPFINTWLCKDTLCRKVYIDCNNNNPWTGLFCNTNLVQNGNFEIGEPRPIILKNGFQTMGIDNWSLFPNPGNGIVVADTGRGSFDSRSLTFIGNQNNFAGVVCRVNDWTTFVFHRWRLSFQHQNYYIPSGNTILQFRLQVDSLSKDPQRDYILYEFPINNAGSHSWTTHDTLIEIDTSKVNIENKFLVICLQNDSQTEYSAVGFDNLEICTEDKIRLSTEDKPDMDANFILYPNPTTDLLTLSWLDKNAFVIEELHVLDITGKCLFIKQVDAGVNTTTVDVSLLKPGLYFMQINRNNKIMDILKFIKN